jgi:hypothetical protein
MTEHRNTTMTKDDRKRRTFIIAELCRLSRDGWANARPCDYQALEAELSGLNAKRSFH